MKSSVEIFGKIENQEIKQYTLENNNKMKVKIMEFGATITSISIPGKDNKPVSLVAGFDDFESYFSDEYKANAPYFGCTVGRYSSQIKDAKFEIEGKTYQLATNCGLNNLHGGNIGFDKRVWSSAPFESDNAVGITFKLACADMEEGYPGNVDIEVKMSLTNANEIIIEYSANTDKTTPLSLTNHTYWNLSGFREDVLSHKVAVNTNKLLELDETGAATGVILDVTDTANDLMQGSIVKDVHDAIGDGFEHFYVFEDLVENPIKIAVIESSEADGRKLEVFSTEPCMLFYTAKYTSDALQRSKDEKYGKFRAFACETHRYPNGPNLPESPSSFTRPEKAFKSTTTFKLSW